MQHRGRLFDFGFQNQNELPGANRLRNTRQLRGGGAIVVSKGYKNVHCFSDALDYPKHHKNLRLLACADGCTFTPLRSLKVLRYAQKVVTRNDVLRARDCCRRAKNHRQQRCSHVHALILNICEWLHGNAVRQNFSGNLSLIFFSGLSVYYWRLPTMALNYATAGLINCVYDCNYLGIKYVIFSSNVE